MVEKCSEPPNCFATLFLFMISPRFFKQCWISPIVEHVLTNSRDKILNTQTSWRQKVDYKLNHNFLISTFWILKFVENRPTWVSCETKTLQVSIFCVLKQLQSKQDDFSKNVALGELSMFCSRSNWSNSTDENATTSSGWSFNGRTDEHRYQVGVLNYGYFRGLYYTGINNWLVNQQFQFTLRCANNSWSLLSPTALWRRLRTWRTVWTRRTLRKDRIGSWPRLRFRRLWSRWKLLERIRTRQELLRSSSISKLWYKILEYISAINQSTLTVNLLFTGIT